MVATLRRGGGAPPPPLGMAARRLGAQEESGKLNRRVGARQNASKEGKELSEQETHGGLGAQEGCWGARGWGGQVKGTLA